MAVPATTRDAALERIQLPDVHRPERMPCLPGWVALRVASLKTEAQPDPISGKWREVPTLPLSLLLSPAERDEIAGYVAKLNGLCNRTPANDATAAQDTLVVVTRMMLVLSAAKQNEISAEARGEAFMDATDDLPPWSVAAAERRWYRGECGMNEQGEPYDCHWCPAPAELRKIALRELWRVKTRAESLARVLRAEPLRDFTDEHCRAMRVKLADLFRNFGSPLVGNDGSGGAAGEGRPVAPTVGPDQGANPA
jgi:hypothetical protein